MHTPSQGICVFTILLCVPLYGNLRVHLLWIPVRSPCQVSLCSPSLGTCELTMLGICAFTFPRYLCTHCPWVPVHSLSLGTCEFTFPRYLCPYHSWVPVCSPSLDTCVPTFCGYLCTHHVGCLFFHLPQVPVHSPSLDTCVSTTPGYWCTHHPWIPVCPLSVDTCAPAVPGYL